MATPAVSFLKNLAKRAALNKKALLPAEDSQPEFILSESSEAMELPQIAPTTTTTGPAASVA